MADDARFQRTTTVRQPRIALLWAAILTFPVLMMAAAFVGAHAHIGNIASTLSWILGPVLAGIQARPKIQQLAVDASPEGLRVGTKLVPRAKLKSALLRREGERTFVLLHGTSSFARIDVEVTGDEEADRLCSALKLDAKSTTAEFSVFQKTARKGAIVALTGIVATAIALGVGVSVGSQYGIPAALRIPALLVPILVLMGSLLLWNRTRTTRLRVGADGVVVRQGLGRANFYRHDSITEVRAEGREIVLVHPPDPPMRFHAGGAGKRKKDAKPDEGEQIAKSIVWRIEKAREAYRSLAGTTAAQGALVLERGARTTREWLDELRRVGEESNATFRSALLTRDQLLGIVESSSAAAKERLAAAVALRSNLTEDEKPRLRVAAERCALPELRERMVRVIDAPSEEELATALDEADADAPRAKRAS